MKTIIAICCFLALSLADVHDQQATILRQENVIDPDGTHSYLYETGNGIYGDQQGYSKGLELQASQGQFQYVSPEGQTIYLKYVADENGFHPTGSHLPTPPPIPSLIQKSLEYIARTQRLK